MTRDELTKKGFVEQADGTWRKMNQLLSPEILNEYPQNSSSNQLPSSEPERPVLNEPLAEAPREIPKTVSEFELLYLRFLQCQRDFPRLNHQPEHGPQNNYYYAGATSLYHPYVRYPFKRMDSVELCEQQQRAFCEREFNRSA